MNLPVAHLSDETVKEFNHLVHDAIAFQPTRNKMRRKLYDVWMYFLEHNLHMKKNADGSVGDRHMNFGVEFRGKRWLNDDLQNNMITCHNQFAQGGSMHYE